MITWPTHKAKAAVRKRLKVKNRPTTVTRKDVTNASR